MSAEQEAALVCRDLTYVFPGGLRGLSGVDLTIGRGEACGLVGANGAGKSTLIHLCLSSLRPQRGEVWAVGVDALREPVTAKRLIAYVPEVARLYSSLSGLQNLIFFEGLMGRSHSVTVYEELMESLAFPKAALRDPSRTYSKGMRQKIALALGLLKGAELFLLDEPSSGLDLPSVMEFSRLVQGLTAAGKAVLISTHDLSLLGDIVHRVALLDRGRLVLDERIDEFRNRDLLSLFWPRSS